MYLIEEPELVRPHMWAGRIPPMYLDHLKDGFTSMGPYSVISARIVKRGDSLAFDPTSAQLLCKGVCDEAIFLNTDFSEYSEIEPRTRPSEQARGDSDAAFVTACRQLVNEEFAALANILVKKVRRAHPGRLVEGQGRKWLNHPDNFMAITIQNRDRSLAFSIREVSEAQDSVLRPKPDRPGYLRFKVSKPVDIGEAMRLILASARRS